MDLTAALTPLSRNIYEDNKDRGWHEEEPDMGAFVANIHGEVSELWEAYRRGQLDCPCDKSAGMSWPLTCLEEELADIVIRALDMAGTYRINIGKAVRIKLDYNATRPYRHGGKVA